MRRLSFKPLTEDSCNRILFMFFAAATLLPCAPLSAVTLPSGDFSFLTTALVRNDNDFDYFDHKSGKSVPLPPVVKRAIQKEAESYYKEAYIDKDPRHLPAPKDVIHTIFKISGPQSLELYVPYYERIDINGFVYFFYLYDPKSGAITKAPIGVDSRWLGEGDNPADYPLRKPYVTFVDLFHDGSQVMVCQGFYHNGTESSTAVYGYEYIGKDMSETQVLEYRSGFQTHYFKEKVPDENSVPHALDVTRTVQPAGKNQIELTTTVSLDGQPPVVAGIATLKCGKPGEPF